MNENPNVNIFHLKWTYGHTVIGFTGISISINGGLSISFGTGIDKIYEDDTFFTVYE